MTRQIRRTSLNKEELKEYYMFSDRIGISNDSDLIKKAIKLSNIYLDFIENLVPQEVFQAYLDKLHYTKKASKKNLTLAEIHKLREKRYE